MSFSTSFMTDSESDSEVFMGGNVESNDVRRLLNDSPVPPVDDASYVVELFRCLKHTPYGCQYFR